MMETTVMDQLAPKPAQYTTTIQYIISIHNNSVLLNISSNNKWLVKCTHFGKS